jgi:hypothetical protein
MVKVAAGSSNGRHRCWWLRHRILLLWGGGLAISMVLVRFVSRVGPPPLWWGATSMNKNNNQKQQQGTTTPPLPPLPLFQTTPPMALMLRMSGTLQVHRYRFLCTLLRSTVLFWNEAYSQTLVLVLDDEMESDHEFGETVARQLQELLPDWNVRIQARYEALPTNLEILSNQTGLEKQRPGYKRQLYSSFWSDTFVVGRMDHENNKDGDNDRDGNNDRDDDSAPDDDDGDILLVFLDVDAMFLSPVTGPSIFDDVEEDDPAVMMMMMRRRNISQQNYRRTHPQQEQHLQYRRPRIYGANCSFGKAIVEKWRMTTRMAIGFPMVADFMTTFPVYIYASTIRNCRTFILQRMGTSNMEDAFAWLNPPTFAMSPICILLNYAWYYERHRYSWSFQICPDSVSDNKNKMIPPKDRIVIEDDDNDHNDGTTIRSNVHTGKGTPWPQTAFHQPYARLLTNTTLEASYCLASRSLVNLQEEILRHETTTTTTTTTTAGGSLMGDRRSSSSSSSSAVTDGVASALFDLPHQCHDKVYDWKDNFVLFHHDLQRVAIRPPPCDGTESFCTDRLQQHYRAYAQEVLGIDPRPRKPKQQHSPPPVPRRRRPIMDWSHITKVEDLAAKHWATTCPPITSVYV